MSRHSTDLTQGPILKQFIVYTIPILLTNIMQQLYHAADVMVVGRFAQDTEISLAAVSSSGSVTTLLLNIFFGLSVGANIVCANLYGARKREELRIATETALIVALGGGILIGAIGAVFSEDLLRMIGTPESILPYATTYMRIIFLGQPGSLVYNFCGGILRAHGDTRRPMFILMSTGIVNVLLNLVFVMVFHWDSAGVALATISASYLSAAIALFLLFHDREEFDLDWKKMHFDKKQFFKILRIGIPCGTNGAVFSVSNVLIASGINSLGPTVVAAKGAAESIAGMIYQIVAACYSACVSFVGQNFGAKKFDRIKKCFRHGVMVVEIGLGLAAILVFLFPDFLVGIFTEDPVLIETSKPYLYMVGCGYTLYGISEVALGCFRGMGYSTFPTILNVCCICIPRLIWVIFLFPLNPTFAFLMICYPLSWIISASAQTIGFFVTFRREKRKYANRLETGEESVPAIPQ